MSLSTIDPLARVFADDGTIPNNPLPFLVYRGAIDVSRVRDPAKAIEQAYAKNGWGHGLWRNGIYPFVHYHSQIHEVLGIARGSGRVQFGGTQGRTFVVKAGDVAILPAGTGHQCLSASKDFLVVGAYPPTGKYDECTSSRDHARAINTIAKVALPRKDPVYGGAGPLRTEWRR